MGISETEPVVFNPFEPGFRDDPYRQYERLRETEPVHHAPMGGWVLTRYADIWSLLRDQRVSSSEIMSEAEREMMLRALGLWEAWQDSVVREFVNATLLTMDPPEHTRVRALVSKAFTPKAVERLRPHIEELVDVLLEPFEGTVDVVKALAEPLPALVICELLGVPEADRAELQTLSHAGTVLVEPMIDAEQLRSGDAALSRLIDYFEALVEERRRQPQADLLTALAITEIEGERLDDRELAVNAILLFAAGHETTTNLIGTGTLALLEHPDQLALLRADPGLVPGAVDEFLRYESPVQFTARRAAQPIVIGDHEIPASERIIVVLGAGNRDPARYAKPDHLDVTRTDVQPLTFGGGIHYCLGAALAKAEAQTVFRKLLVRFPEMSLDGDPVRRRSFTLRGLTSLPVAVCR
ncbi:MAG: cytochrome P450 [Acidimicrobiia bacterium]|nr:cytochrome P450 [Acidimicrobiia bacterium]